MAGSLFPLPAEVLAPLRTYLVGQLAPISDADSALLSDYTVALLKAAEASDDEVEDEVKTQLRDFLDHNTDSFVQTLFEALRSKSYMPAAQPSASSTRKRSRSPSSTRSPPKAPRLQSPAQGPSGAQGVQPSLAHPLPPMPVGSAIVDSSVASSSAGGGGGGGGSNGRPPKQCFEYHQRGFCSKGPSCTFDHDPTYQGYIPPPFQVAQQLAMAGMGDHVDYGSIWQGRGPMQFGAMPGMGGFGMPGMAGPPFGGFPSQMEGGPPGGPGRPPGMAGHGPPVSGWQPQQGDFRPPPHGMMPNNGGPPMMMGGGPRGGPGGRGPRPNRNGDGPRGGGGGGGGRPQRASVTDASNQPPAGRKGKTLVILDIPASSLTVPAVQDYFAKFGPVASVALDERSPRALVEFEVPEDAYKAWKSEEAVFGSRFVKVLWHRPMEGQGAKGLEALEAGKATVDGGDKDALMSDVSAAPPPPALSRAEILVKQRLLESQIAQQKVLMARLSAPDLPADEKLKLMAQFSKLSDEMKAGKGSLSLVKPASTTAANAAGNRTATFTPAKEEEAMSSDAAAMDGVDAGTGEAPAEISQTEMLQRKLEVLKAEAALIGVDPNAPSSPGPPASYNPAARGRGRGRGRGAPRGAFRGGYNTSYGSPAAAGAHKSLSLDFRTKSIAVAGDGLVDDHEAVGAVERWFETIGGVDSSKVDESAKRIIVTFKSRPLAEKALARGNNITDLSIPTSLTWFNAPPPAAPPAAAPAAEEERNTSRDWDADEEEDGQRRR